MLTNKERVELHIILETMRDIGDNVSNKFWLMRNLKNDNKDHVHYERALELIRKM